MPEDCNCPEQELTCEEKELQKTIIEAAVLSLGNFNKVSQADYENLTAPSTDEIIAAIKVACKVIVPLCKVVNGE